MVAPDQDQAAALEGFSRIATQQAADNLDGYVSTGRSSGPSRSVEAVEQAVDAASNALAGLEPALQSFYAKLHDEQKARLLRDMVDTSPAGSGNLGASVALMMVVMDTIGVENRRRGRASSASPTWGMLREHMTVALRGWPISEVERNVRLSEGQRVSFYELGPRLHSKTA